MMKRWTAILWIVLALAATFAATQAIPAPEESWLLPLIVVIWTVTAVALLPSPLRQVLRVPLHWLREHPIFYWLLLLVYIFGAIVLWLVAYQPTNGRQLTPVEFVYIAAALWGLVFLLAYDAHAPQLRQMGSKLGKSRLTGVMVTLSTVIVLLVGAEAYLRVFYITTDGYGFTAMNYWWYKNYGWAHPNSLGYRDYEPTPNDPANPLTRIAIVGDSFAMGHGINNLDDTFAQVLERRLGAGYDVNLIAESGLDSDVELSKVENYPLLPNVVVLSYYLNDIDYLMTSNTPDSNFNFPQNDLLAKIVLDFFLPNYVYYNLMQFTSSTRTTNFAYDLIGAHMDESLWTPQRAQLQRFVDWMNERNIRLIVLLWPQLAQVEASTPATQRVRGFFEAQGVRVVDMTDVLRGKNVAEMTVNRFDSHPSIAANQLAADQLYDAILTPEAGT
ncbi:MAG: hypothetical protein ABI835_13710 [Chloroflexota bacterium]